MKNVFTISPKKGAPMNKGFLSYWRRAAGTKRIVYPMIAFFLLTPFLLSCGGSGGTPGAEPASPSRILTSAVDSQNQSAQDAVLDVIALASTFAEGQEAIEATLGTMTPTLEGIELWASANPNEADVLVNRLDLLFLKAQQHAYQYEGAIADLIQQETVISREMGLNGGTRELVSVGSALILLTLAGAGAGAMKGAVEAFNACSYLPDNTTAEQAKKLECIISRWPQSAADAIKGTISSGVTTAASWAAGIKKWRTVKFLIDGYGAYDSADSISQAFGVRSCEQTHRSLSQRALLPGRQLQMIDFEDLTPDDVYIGTSEDGAFHNVPEGDWTFVFFEDGYLRQQTRCVAVGGEDPIEVPVTMIPIEALPIEPPPDDNGNNCIDPPCDSDPPVGTTVSATVSIPGYSSFAPSFVAITLGTCSENDGTYPTIYASSGGRNPDPRNSDTLILYLNNNLGFGTWNLETGPCGTPFVGFNTKNILETGSEWPVGFGSYAGSITIENYGTTYGERITGSFAVWVEGNRCLDLECENEEVIQGTISGNFDGVITDFSATY